MTKTIITIGNLRNYDIVGCKGDYNDNTMDVINIRRNTITVATKGDILIISCNTFFSERLRRKQDQGWYKCREASDVLYDRRMQIKLREKLYRKIVRTGVLQQESGRDEESLNNRDDENKDLMRLGIAPNPAQSGIRDRK